MSDDVTKYLEADIPDPTDFSPDAPGLRSLDEALRCTMCRELFEAPVTVNCPQNHCFCSLCIRTAIATKDECPICRQPILEVHLRKNPAIEDAVKAWNLARPFILEVLRARAKASAAAEELKASSKYFPEKPKPKKRKRTPDPSSDDEIVELGERKASDSSEESSPTGVVSCPMCHKKVPMQTINNHIDDGCPPPQDFELEILSSPPPKSTQKQEWSKLFQGGEGGGQKKVKGKGRATEPDTDAEPLPKVAYNTVSQKRLREIVDEMGLQTNGDKTALAARHSRWVNMFNANLDASVNQRKSTKQMMLELRRWEEIEEKKKSRSKLDTKNLDTKQYQKEHKSTFARLVKTAKLKKPKRPESSGEASLVPSSDVACVNNVVETSQQPREITSVEDS